MVLFWRSKKEQKQLKEVAYTKTATAFKKKIKTYFTFTPMADVHNKKQRSYNMSRIRSTNTKPELLVRKFLFETVLIFN